MAYCWVAQGLTCPEVARLLGDAPRSVEYWVHRYEREGLSGLNEGERSGRPGRLSEMESNSACVNASACSRNSNFRLRKPRPLLARGPGSAEGP